MATNLTGSNELYGVGQGLFEVARGVAVIKRAPTTSDKGNIGQQWINPDTNSVWQLTSIVSGSFTWTLLS